jgi:hypothetical protein
MNRTSWHNSWTIFEHLNHRNHRKMVFNAIWTKIKFKIHDKLRWTSSCTYEGGFNSFWCIYHFHPNQHCMKSPNFQEKQIPFSKLKYFHILWKFSNIMSSLSIWHHFALQIKFYMGAQFFLAICAPSSNFHTFQGMNLFVIEVNFLMTFLEIFSIWTNFDPSNPTWNIWDF